MNYKVSETISHFRVDIDSIKGINQLADFIEKEGIYTVTQTSSLRNLGQSYLILMRNKRVRQDEVEGLIKDLNKIIQSYKIENNF